MIDSPTTPVEVVQDERGGMSSASGLDRVANCPGSQAAEKGLEPLPVDDIADEGTRIHESFESGDDSDLDMTQREIAEKLRAMEQRELDNWKSAISEGQI